MPKVAPAQTLFNSGEFSPLMLGRVDFKKYSSALALCLNTVPLTQGPATRRPGTKFVLATKDSTKLSRLVRFQFSTEQAYMLEFGHNYIRVFRNRGVVESSPGVPLEIVTTYTQSDIWRLKFTQSADVLYIVHPSYSPKKLSRTSHTSWSLSTMTTEDGPWLPVNSTATTLSIDTATVGAGRTLTASGTTGINNNTGFQTTDVGRLFRMRTSGAAWGWGRITARTSTTVVTVEVLAAIGAGATPTATWRLGLWSDTTGYPGAITFFEDRLVADGGPAAPQTIVGSRTGSYENFAPTAYDTSATVADDNGYNFTLNSRDVQAIRWLNGDEKGLLIGTFAGEWVLRASTAGQALSPTNVVAKQIGSAGSNTVQAVSAGKATLFIQKSGRKLREFAYDYTIDGFKSSNMSVLSDHMTYSGLVDMTFQSEPHSLIWAARADGVLTSFNYDREQNSYGWARHVLGGYKAEGDEGAAVESVCCIPEPNGAYDEVWLIVKRYIGGQTVRYVEYMTKFWETGDEQEDAFYLDSGGTYDGAATDTLTSGLSHLIGETLDCLLDGAAHPPVIVQPDGSVEFNKEASKIQIGLGYRSRGTTLRFEAGAANGTAQGKKQRIHQVTFRVLDTLGLRVGPNFDTLDRMVETYRSMGDLLGAKVPLYTGDTEQKFDGEYTTEALICWEFAQPLPGTILLIAPQLDTQD